MILCVRELGGEAWQLSTSHVQVCDCRKIEKINNEAWVQIPKLHIIKMCRFKSILFFFLQIFINEVVDEGLTQPNPKLNLNFNFSQQIQSFSHEFARPCEIF